MAKGTIELKLKPQVWDFFLKLSDEQNKSINDIVLEYTGLNDFKIEKDIMLTISKRDRGIFPAVWSIFSLLESLEIKLIKIIKESNNKGYLLILKPIQTCKTIMDVLISVMDKCVEMPLTSTEQDACNDLSVFMVALHNDIIEYPSYLKRIVRILKKIGLPNIRKELD